MPDVNFLDPILGRFTIAEVPTNGTIPLRGWLGKMSVWEINRELAQSHLNSYCEHILLLFDLNHLSHVSEWTSWSVRAHGFAFVLLHRFVPDFQATKQGSA
jgi:hypothetical protein